MAERGVATVTRMVGNKEGNGKGGRAMATATKRALATNHNNMGNGYSKEGGGPLMAVVMAMGMGTAQRTWPLVLQLERGG